MKYLYCPNCRKKTGHKRVIGMGTLLGAVLTVGASLNAVPFYPKRCIVCGRKSSGKEDDFIPSRDVRQEEQGEDTKKCPVCAETIKLEAIKCRFCGEQFDPTEVARQVSEVRNEDSFTNRALCSDGNCIGVIGPNGRCKLCGKPY